MTKVSVIVPIYNVEPYLDTCIQSLLQQSYEDLQIILVNDGSIDKSLDICKRYTEKDKRILLINQENKGHGPALNSGLKRVKGEFVMFCDGDDFYFPDMVEHLVEVAKTTNAEVATCAAYAFDDQSGEVSLDPYHSQIQIPLLSNSDCVDKSQIEAYSDKLAVQYWAKIYRTDWLRQHNISFTNQKMSYDDIPFHWFVLSKLNKLALVRSQLYGYRMNREGASFTHIKQPEYFFAYELAKSVVLENQPRLIDPFLKTCIGDWWWLYKRENISINIDSTLKSWLSDTAIVPFLSEETLTQAHHFLQRNKLHWQLKQNIKNLLWHRQISG